MSSPPLVSVCILAGHGPAALDLCLASLRAQSRPPPYEVLVGAPALDPALLSVAHRHFPRAAVCQTGRRLPGAARNPLIERARGDLLLFLDDDVALPPDLLSTLAQAAADHPDVGVFGGPNQTPPDSPRFHLIQGAVLSSLVGAGPVSGRYGVRRPGPTNDCWLTLCNLAVRRSAMRPFLTQLVCAEENALLTELRIRGEKMRYEPRLRVFHSRRDTPRSFAAQMVKYGRGRGELLRRWPRTARVSYLTPIAFLAYVLLVPVMLSLNVPWTITFLPAAAYLALILGSALRIGWKMGRPADFLLAAGLTITVHVCYACGVLRGFLLPARARAEPVVHWMSAGDPVGVPTQQHLLESSGS